jgi:hypothetical protein
MPLSNAEKQRRYRKRRAGGVTPTRDDIARVEARYGPLHPKAPLEEQAHRYRLWQAQALIRMWRNHELPPEMMREMNELADRNA